MNVLRDLAYEIVSAGLGLSAFLFFGIISFSPFMLMLFGERNDVPLAVIMILVSLAGSMVLVSATKATRATVIARVADIAAMASAILVLLAYLSFSSHTHEPWLTQGGWFLRYHGGVVGCFLGATTVKIVSSVSFLISRLARDDALASARNAAPALVIAVAFGGLGAAMFLYRAVNFLGPVVFFLAGSAGSLALATLETRPGRPQSTLLQELLEDPLVPPGVHGHAARVAGATGDATGDATGTRASWSLLQRLSRRLALAGTRSFDFWVFVLPVLFFGGLAIASAIAYPADLTFVVEILFEGNRIRQVLHFNEVIPVATLLLAFLVSPFIVYLGVARGKLHLSTVKGIAKKLQIGTVSFFDGLRHVLTALLVSLFCYYYDYELFSAGVIGTIASCAVAGAGLYWALARFKGARHLLAALATIILMVNILVIYDDAVHNGFIFYDGSFDVTFTLAYLHGAVNLASCGIAIGILCCDLLKDAGFDHAGSGGDSTNRAVLIALTFLVTGMLVIPAGFALDLPGGDPTWPTGQIDPSSVEGSVFYWISIGAGVALVVVCIARAVTGWILPAVARGNAAATRGRTMPGTARGTLPKHLHVVTLLSVVACSVVAGASTAIVFQVTVTRPILAYSPGGYCIWLEESASRVSKDMLVSCDLATRASTVNVSMARNEYHAFQLVVRAFSNGLTGFTWNVTGFDHASIPSAHIPASACNMRYERRVLDDEYPDMLVPFSSMDLSPGLNHVLWFSLRTPYNVSAGRYTGAIDLRFGNGQHERIVVSVSVWNFTVPRTRHLRAQVGGDSWSAGVVQNFIDHRINDYGISIPCSWNGTNYTYDWTSWDANIQAKLDAGANSFIIDGGPGWTHDGRTPFVDDPGLMNQLGNWLKGVQQHLVEKNWTRYGYIYYVDEFQMFIPARYGYNRSAYFSDLETQLRFMKEAAPLLRIMTTSPPTAELERLKAYIDIFCPVASDYDEQQWDAYKAAGKEFWIYSCVQPWAPWPNSHLYNRLHETRVLIWQAWHYQLHGFLYWSAQAYYHGKNGLGYNGYGDGWFLYQDGSLHDSMRWENYLDGMEDYEYAWLLDATINHLEATGHLSASEASAKRATLVSLTTAVTRDRWHYCDTPAPIYRGRVAMGDMLHELSACTNITAIGEAPWDPLA